MDNLLTETLEAIEKSGHSVDDVIFIGSEDSGHSCSWERFVELADQEYDGGFGAQKVATDLIVVFSDGQKMWRSEYDGSEWWEYSTPFIKQSKSIEIKGLFTKSIGWDTLLDIN